MPRGRGTYMAWVKANRMITVIPMEIPIIHGQLFSPKRTMKAIRKKGVSATNPTIFRRKK
jgi:hypothetical protein